MALDLKEMEIGENHSVGLIGESGSGKTTIAKLLMRLIKPDEGIIEYRGKNLNDLTRSELREYRQRCQMIFQDPSAQFNPRMKIYDILREPILINKMALNEEERIAEVLNLVSLPTDIRHRYIHQISGGQRQRISIARALISNPSFIICDEPVSALDISVQSQILNLLYDLKNNLNVNYLMISHDLSVVRFLCDFVYILYNGKIVEQGKTCEIFQEPVHPYTKELMESALLKIDDSKLLGMIDDSHDEMSGLCPYTRCSRYSCCRSTEIREIKITDTHRVFCNV
ncbi:MAG: ATP-binding cassette domain-containing protein [Deltaproteobacteria bacterium]|nr:ATP-binding cassette domain-containing protein [Deltaproteobacteria bacterium]